MYIVVKTRSIPNEPTFVQLNKYLTMVTNLRLFFYREIAF